MFGRCTFFLVGLGCGAYVAQNYNIPNVAVQAQWVMQKAKQMEAELKRPSAADGSSSMIAAQMSPAKIR